MASLSTDAKGHRRILFMDGDGRKVVRLGKCSQRQAESFKGRIESLLSVQRLGGTVDDETARWIAALGDDLHSRLSAADLVSPRVNATLGAFLDEYLSSRVDLKPGTILAMQQAQKSLIDYFGRDRRLREVTTGDAEPWRLSMVQQGLADATVRKRCQRAKQFATAAMRRKLISENPFAGLPSANRGNDKRLFFVSQETTQRILDLCPDAESRVLFALARFGGLRTPSETLRLRWADVDWDRGRITVHSPKTEHHEGHESRQIPLFPELLVYLREAFELAEPGAEHVIDRHRQTSCYLRLQFYRIIKRAGLKVWPRLFQNLRSSRQTELCERFPEHVVCAWLGNSKAIAREHYLQIRDEDFLRAAEPEKAAQNPARAAHNGANLRQSTMDENRVFDRENAVLQSASLAPLAPRGFEPLSPG